MSDQLTNPQQTLKVSILTPSYQSADCIETAIDSVLSQGYPHFEHIIVDGGSTDGTVDILTRYPHLRWVSEADHGQTDAMNKAFDMASGDIIVYLNADDWFEAGAFQAINSAFLQTPHLDMVVGNLYLRKQGQSSFLVVPAIEHKKVLSHFAYPFPLNPVCYFYRKQLQERVGPFPLDNHLTMDYWFLLHALSFANVIKIDRVLGTFWIRPQSKTMLAGNSRANCRKVALVYLKKYAPLRIPLYWMRFWGYLIAHEYWPAAKKPFKRIVYQLFFAHKMSYETFQQLSTKRLISEKSTL